MSWNATILLVKPLHVLRLTFLLLVHNDITIRLVDYDSSHMMTVGIHLVIDSLHSSDTFHVSFCDMVNQIIYHDRYLILLILKHLVIENYFLGQCRCCFLR